MVDSLHHSQACVRTAHFLTASESRSTISQKMVCCSHQEVFRKIVIVHLLLGVYLECDEEWL